MIISGLLLTLSKDPRMADRALATLRARPEFLLATCHQRWLPVVVEVPDVATSRDLHDWLHTLPGVDFVDVVQVSFEEDSLEPSPGGHRNRVPPSADCLPPTPSKRRRTTPVQEVGASHAPAVSMIQDRTQEATHEH